MSRDVLIVVDVQRDFCEGGALAASDTLSLLAPLQQFIEAARRAGVAIVYTQDWHPAAHSSFQTNGGPWPVHCVAQTRGSQLMPPLRPNSDDIVVQKGVAVDGAGYSAFEASGLAGRLRSIEAERIAVTGIATEYCVRATALDAAAAGFETSVLVDLIRPVNASETPKILEELQKAGLKTVSSGEWL